MLVRSLTETTISIDSTFSVISIYYKKDNDQGKIQKRAYKDWQMVTLSA